MKKHFDITITQLDDMKHAKRKLFNETVYHVSDEGLLLLSNVLSIEIIKPEE